MRPPYTSDFSLPVSPYVVWFTGLPAAGKTTMAQALHQLLQQQGRAATLLDGDRLRQGISANLGFSAADRSEAVRRAACVAQLLLEAGQWVLVAQIAPQASDRALARDLIGSRKFVEVFCDTPLNVCEQRDPKGLYKKARAGEIRELTGFDAVYEPPLRPDVHLLTGQEDLDGCLKRLIDFFGIRQ